ncbi:MAG: hypothetical protein C5B54_08700 [Acidobacteria bacterium]|nr:MAG: hypothetical protein C5B54_08700 [Acidobacteriota bacterium]
MSLDIEATLIVAKKEQMLKRVAFTASWLLLWITIGAFSSHFFPGSRPRHIYGVFDKRPGYTEMIEFDSTPDSKVVLRNLVIGCSAGALCGLLILRFVSHRHKFPQTGDHSRSRG